MAVPRAISGMRRCAEGVHEIADDPDSRYWSAGALSNWATGIPQIARADARRIKLLKAFKTARIWFRRRRS